MSTLEYFGMLNMPKCSKVDISWNYNQVSKYSNYTVQLWTLQNYKMLIYNYLHKYKVISVGMQHWYVFLTLMQHIPNLYIHPTDATHIQVDATYIWMLMQHVPKVGATSAYTDETSSHHWCNVIHAVASMLDQLCQNDCDMPTRITKIYIHIYNMHRSCIIWNAL